MKLQYAHIQSRHFKRSNIPRTLKVTGEQKVERRLFLLTVEESAKWMQVSIRQKMVNPLPQAETTSALTSK